MKSFRSTSLFLAFVSLQVLACGGSDYDDSQPSGSDTREGDGVPAGGSGGSAGSAGSAGEAGAAGAAAAGGDTDGGVPDSQPDAELPPDGDAGPDAEPCPDGFEDCDGDPLNGCETDLRTDADNCGACGSTCPSGNGTPSCVSSACAIECDDGWEDCNGDVADGCETEVSQDVANCGTCGNACPVGGHGAATCAAGSCGVECDAGWGNCDGSPGNGCEVDLNDTLDHCGACGHACPSLANATSSCASGTCGFTCDPGWEDCNGAAADGCEVDLMSDVDHCGGCGEACGTANGIASCSGGDCSIQCDAGFADCNGDNGDGCEVDLQSDPANCGVCGHGCGGGTCGEGLCEAWEIASPGTTLIRLATNDTHVYWTEFAGIHRVPKPGGTAEKLASGGNYVGLTTDDTHAYWTVFSTGPGRVGRVPLAGGNPVTLVNNVPKSSDIRVTDTTVYWMHENGIDAKPKSGMGFVSHVAQTDGVPWAMEVDGGSIFYLERAQPAGSLKRVFLSNPLHPVTLVTGLVEPYGLALDDTHAYFTDKGEGVVWRVEKDGSNPQQIYTTPKVPTGIAVDEEHYYVGLADRVVQRAKDGAGTSLIRRADASKTGWIIQDDGVLYWIESGTNKIYAMVI